MDPVSADLLLAVIGGIGGAVGQQAWNGLSALVRRPFRHSSPDTVEAPPSGVDELVMLQQAPASREAATRLAGVLQVRAETDAEFRAALQRWLSEVRAALPAGGGDVHNQISGGTQHGHVFQGRDFSGLTVSAPPPPASDEGTSGDTTPAPPTLAEGRRAGRSDGARDVQREGNPTALRMRGEAVHKGAQAIAAARERGDRQAEAAALVALSRDLRNCGQSEEAGEAARLAMALAVEERGRRGVEEAGRVLADARDRSDGIAEVLALLDRGRFLDALGQHAEAEAHFTQAVLLAQTAADRSGPEWPVCQRSLSSMAKALREAGLEEAALAAEEQSGSAEGNRASVTVSNRADQVHAHNVVQVGVVHGGLHVTAEPVARREVESENALKVSVTSNPVLSTIYEYEGLHVHPDHEVHVFVEAFTQQAVLLRRLRPVFVRRPAIGGVSHAIMLEPRKFRVGLDRPARRYDADVLGQALRLDRAFAEGCADFPFYVTASAPEYFVIWAELRGLVEWRLELDWSCLGQHGTVTIDHGDRPFLSDSSGIRLLDWDPDRKRP